MAIVRANPKGKNAVLEKIASVGNPVEIEKRIKRDDWNEMIVIVSGNHFIHMINGRVTSIGIDEDPAKRRSSGIFAFQLHNGPPMRIELKDIRTRVLKRGVPGNPQ